MKIFLVRHTDFENPGNIFAFHLPVYLSEKGRKDAVKIGKWFVQNKMSKLPIYTSPMLRCVQTAELISSQTKSMVRVDKRLIEISCPNLQGTKKPRNKSWIIEQEDSTRESKDKVIGRMNDIYQEKVKQGQDCILVSHGEPITFFYFDLIGKEIPKYPWDPKNENIIVKKGEVVKIEIEDGKIAGAEKFKPL